MHIIENDFAAHGSKYKSRVYCIDCSKFTEDETVGYDSNEYPIIHHTNGNKHRVIFKNDIQFLQDLGTSLCGESARYEIAQMCCISVEKLEQVLADIGEGV